MSFRRHFISTETNKPTHTWTLAKRDITITRAELSNLIAHEVVKHRVHNRINLYDAWVDKSNGIPFPEPKYATILETYLKPILGIPSNPIPDDHVEGYIGEFLWYWAQKDSVDPSIVQIEPPSFKVTDQGGDGLIIHRHSDGTLFFRLWEMKKCTGGSVVATVKKAYNQLDSKALEYLARYSGIGQQLPSAEISAFYSEMIDLWLEASTKASIGVAITTSLSLVPKRCFSSFGKRFPKFTTPSRLRGFLTAIEDFPTFSRDVRDMVWRGL